MVGYYGMDINYQADYNISKHLGKKGFLLRGLAGPTQKTNVTNTLGTWIIVLHFLYGFDIVCSIVV